MNTRRILLCFCLFVIPIVCLNSCALKWNPALKLSNDNIPTSESAILLAKANDLYDRADDLESLKKSMQAYEAVLSRNPGDYEALVQLSNQHILLGTAYTDSRRDKSASFQKAMQLAELAMYSNTVFKDKIESGSTPWEAAGSLGRNEAEAMFYWVTALQYEFKEGMHLAGKIRNVNWMARALIFLDQIEKTRPEFGEGAVAFAKGICYYVLPKSKGGSKKIGEAYLQQSVDTGKNRLLPRWGRAKYFYEVTGDEKKALADLNWVVAQDLDAFNDPYPWRVHFQMDAKSILTDQ